MRLIIQRVKQAAVTIADQKVAEIAAGMVVLVGIAKGDKSADADYLARKTVNLRIFADENGKLNRSLIDCGGQVLVVSQFTLYGDCRRGNRPDFFTAAAPDEAQCLYEYYVKQLQSYGLLVQTGVFQADMLVDIANDGPVTIIIESEAKKGE